MRWKPTIVLLGHIYLLHLSYQQDCFQTLWCLGKSWTCRWMLCCPCPQENSTHQSYMLKNCRSNSNMLMKLPDELKMQCWSAEKVQVWRDYPGWRHHVVCHQVMKERCYIQVPKWRGPCLVTKKHNKVLAEIQLSTKRLCTLNYWSFAM